MSTHTTKHNGSIDLGSNSDNYGRDDECRVPSCHSQINVRNVLSDGGDGAELLQDISASLMDNSQSTSEERRIDNGQTEHDQHNALFSAFKREVSQAASHPEIGTNETVRRADPNDIAEFCRIYDVKRFGADEPNHAELFGIGVGLGEIVPVVYGYEVDDPDEALAVHITLRETFDAHFGSLEVVR